MKTAAIRSTARPPAKGQKRKRAVADAAVLAPAVEAASAHALETPVVAHVNAADPAAPAVSLASSCTVKDAAAIKRSLDALAQADTAVVIDASGVERIDTAIVQLLYAFVRERLNNDREVTWLTPSAALRDAVRLLGVGDLVCLPREEAAA